MPAALDGAAEQATTTLWSVETGGGTLHLHIQGWLRHSDHETKEHRTFAYLHHCAGASSMMMTYVLAILDFFCIKKDEVTDD